MNNKKGFTLVELLVVLVIMAVLAAAIIPSFMGFIDKSKNTDCMIYMRQLRLAYKVEYNEDYGLEKNSGFEAILNKAIPYLETSPTPTVSGTSENTATLNGVCPDGGVVTATDLGRSEITLNCSIHGEVTGEAGDGNEENTGHNGFTVPDKTPDSIKSFFSSSWNKATDKNNVSFDYRTFTYEGKNYCLILSSNDIDASSAKDKIQNIEDYETIQGEDGKLTTDSDLRIISKYLGLDKTIDDISFKDGEITKINYKS